jgi:hypothetical protein
VGNAGRLGHGRHEAPLQVVAQTAADNEREDILSGSEEKVGQVGDAREDERQLKPVAAGRTHPVANRPREVTNYEP